MTARQRRTIYFRASVTTYDRHAGVTMGRGDTVRLRLLEADAIDGMRELDGDSAGSIVTDPPYGLRFMGRAWDHGSPGVPYWQEALRVLQPGGYALVFGGTRTYHRLAVAIEDAGFELIDTIAWLYGTGKPASTARLKPGWEPITLARKPGPGGLTIDACRVNPGEIVRGGGNGRANHGGNFAGGQRYRGERPIVEPHAKGRWPANVVLAHDPDCGDLCAARCAVAMLDAQSGVRLSSGGASRFFYCAKASTRERNAGLPTGLRNMHPTIKPLALMRWLVRLVTPTGGLVVDPFCGTGSTGIATIMEGFAFCGIDSGAEPTSIQIARYRLAWAQREYMRELQRKGTA